MGLESQLFCHSLPMCPWASHLDPLTQDSSVKRDKLPTGSSGRLKHLRGESLEVDSQPLLTMRLRGQSHRLQTTQSPREEP